MICTKCKAETVPGAIFCPWCGKKLVTTKKGRTKSRGNGTGTAFKRGSTWTAQVVYDRVYVADDKPLKRLTRSKSGFKTREDALRYCPILKAGPQKPKEAPTLAHYWDTFENGHFSSLGESKQYAYKAAWKRLEKIKNTHIDQLTVANLQQIVAEQCKSFNTARDCKTLLTALFRTAAAEGYVNKDIPSFIQLPKQEETERIPFSDTEQASLWKVYESGDIRAAAPLLMIYTGMMPGEARKLNVANIDMEKRLIIGAGMKTNVRKATPIVMAESILPVVEALIANAQPDGQLWQKWKQKWYKDYYDVLKAAECRPLSPYSCRHTTATALAITEGVAPQTVKKVMRWASTKMLDRYAHPQTSDALAAVNTLKTSHG